VSGTVPSTRRWNQRKRRVGSSRVSPVLFSLVLCLNHLYSRRKWTKGGSLTTNAVSLDTLNTDSIKSVPGDTETTTTSPNPLLEKSSLHPDAPPPDVGIVPWLQVLAGFFLMFNAWGIVLSYGTFQSYYTSPTSPLHDSTSPSAIAWIGSTQAFLLAFGGALSGKYFDAGYFRQMLYAGTFMIVFGLMMTSFATRYYQVLLAQGLCVGGGTGLLLVSSVGLPSTWFVRRRGLAVGIVSTGASVAGIVFPISLRHLIPTVGFGWAARILGFISLSTRGQHRADQAETPAKTQRIIHRVQSPQAARICAVRRGLLFQLPRFLHLLRLFRGMGYRNPCGHEGASRCLYLTHSQRREYLRPDHPSFHLRLSRPSKHPGTIAAYFRAFSLGLDPRPHHRATDDTHDLIRLFLWRRHRHATGRHFVNDREHDRIWRSYGQCLKLPILSA
jgi:MFS family permease